MNKLNLSNVDDDEVVKSPRSIFHDDDMDANVDDDDEEVNILKYILFYRNLPVSSFVYNSLLNHSWKSRIRSVLRKR